MWQFVFWCCIGVVLYSYVGYPLALYVLTRIKNGRSHFVDEDDLPTVCLIISAFNEEKVIRKKIENSLELDYPPDRLTILLASDGSDDRTVDIAREYVGAGVRIFHHPARTGKSAVLNEVVPDVGSEVLVFTDANSLFSSDALVKMVRHFADPKIGCVVGRLRYVDRHTSSVGKGEGLYWRYEGMLSVLESKLGSVLVANGSIFGIRRALFRELYPDVANDFQIPADVASQGSKILYEPAAVAYERTTLCWREEFQRKVRIILRGLTGFSIMREKFRGLRLWQFNSHKLVRWAIGPLLFVALLANVMLMDGSVFYTLLCCAQVIFYFAAFNGWRLRRGTKPHAAFYLPFYFTMVNLAAVFAIAKFVSGERQTVWEKAETSRVAPINVPLRVVHDRATVAGRGFEHAAVARRAAKN